MMKILAPTIDLDLLRELVYETGVEHMTSGQQIKHTWEEIAERYCQEKGMPLLPYKTFSKRWKNAKYYAKVTAQQRAEAEKQTVYITPTTPTPQRFTIPKLEKPSSSDESNAVNGAENVQVTPRVAIVSKFKPSFKRPSSISLEELERKCLMEEHELRLEEMRKRVSHEEELFQLKKEKLELELETARLEKEVQAKKLQKFDDDQDVTVQEIVLQ